MTMRASVGRLRILMLVVFIAPFAFSSRTVSAADDFDSLRAEIAAANRSSSGAISLSADIVLAAPLPPITGSVTIDGGGHTISGDGKYRIFDVSGARLVIRNLTLTKGGGEDGGALRMRGGAKVEITSTIFSDNRASSGGAIVTHGSNNRLTIENGSFSNNHAERWAGAIDVRGGLVTIRRSSFVDNSTPDYGGAIVAQTGLIQISNSTFHGNRAQRYGGAIHVFGDNVTLTHVTMANNVAADAGGNAINRQGGIVKLRNSIVASRASGEDCANGMDQNIGNLSSDGSCGILPIDDPLLAELTGAPAWRPLRDGSLALDAATPEFCLGVDQRGTPRPHGAGCDIGAIESTTAVPASAPLEPPPPCPFELQLVAANTDAPAGGCPAGKGHDVIQLTRDISMTAATPAITSEITIEGNGHTISGKDRFRIFTVKSGKLTLNNLTLTRGSNAELNGAGAAISLAAAGKLEANNVIFRMNYGVNGAAIGARFGGSMTIRNSLFENNRAYLNGGAISMNGGGYANISGSSFIHNNAITGGAISTSSGILIVSNSTFVGNKAREGGAIAADGSLASGALPITLTHVTMLNNRAWVGVGASGIHLFDYSFDNVEFRLRNSILVSQSQAPDCQGRLAQNISNFIADGSCWPKFTGDPMLQEARGTPAFVALQPGSPAIDAASDSVCLESDQLGNRRPLGYGCDIGAIESIPVRETLSDCTVTTTHTLNFREQPGGTRFGAVPVNSTVTATARTAGWFQVEHEGASGWISADYVVAVGSCG